MEHRQMEIHKAEVTVSQGNGNSTPGDDAQHGLEMELGGW